MPRSCMKWTSALLLLTILLQGCASPGARLHYLWPSEEPLSYYRDYATALEYPTEVSERETDRSLFNAPRGVDSLEEVKHLELSLNECIRMALQKATILRDDSSFGSPGNPLLARPAQVPSIFDPAIQGTGFLFGNRGYEAALSDFDARFTSNMTWGRSEDPQNVTNSGVGPGATLVGETGAFSARIEKPLANGGTVSVQNDWNYDGSNNAFRLFQSAYSGFLQTEYRQPLLSGAGTEFTRIAGPANQSLGGVSGVSQGVLISRINGDISLLDFEQSVITLVRDVEQRYWDLYLMLRLYDSEIDAFNDLLRYYNRLRNRGNDVPSEVLYQAEARIFEAEARIKGSLADVLDMESRLRRLMGLTLNDGTFVTPADNPVEAELTPDWTSALTEAFANRPELRKQKWEIRSLELQLTAANNLVRPRLDAVGQYRVNGMGDDLLGEDPHVNGSAFNSLVHGDNTTWNLGLQFAMPLGLRLARNQSRNYELRLAKARASLSEQEREIAYELAAALLTMQRWYGLADSSTRRVRAADKYAAITEDKSEVLERNPQQLDLLLQARIQKRDARQAYLRSVIEYNKGITDLNFRKGTLLTSNGIHLAEGDWTPAAAPFAMKRALDRTHARDNHKLQTEPIEFVQGPAPESWEALGTQTRPAAPDAFLNLPYQHAPQTPAAPDEVPATPLDAEPPPVPPESEPQSVGQPAITQASRWLNGVKQLRQNASRVRVRSSDVGRTTLAD